MSLPPFKYSYPENKVAIIHIIISNVTNRFSTNGIISICFVNISPNELTSTNANIIANICVTVFNFPQMFADITLPFCSTTINLYPEITSSLVITIIGIHAGSLFASTNIKNADITIILSAIGSKNLPKLVI